LASTKVLAEDFRVSRVGSDNGWKSSVASLVSSFDAGRRLVEGIIETDSSGGVCRMSQHEVEIRLVWLGRDR
jgi:hypothetical protein